MNMTPEEHNILTALRDLTGVQDWTEIETPDESHFYRAETVDAANRYWYALCDARMTVYAALNCTSEFREEQGEQVTQQLILPCLHNEIAYQLGG